MESTFLACVNEGWLSYSLMQETLEVIRYFLLGTKHQNNHAFDLGYTEFYLSLELKVEMFINKQIQKYVEYINLVFIHKLYL